MNRLFKLKKIDQLLGDAHSPDKKLKKALGPIDVILLGIGVIIGAGIFATIGTAAAGDAMRPGAGPALMLSFAITGIVCGFAGAVLRRIRVPRPHFRQRLHVFIRHVRGAGRLDHRLGPDA